MWLLHTDYVWINPLVFSLKTSVFICVICGIIAFPCRRQGQLPINKSMIFYNFCPRVAGSFVVNKQRNENSHHGTGNNSSPAGYR
jgi:hypothetical protein